MSIISSYVIREMGKIFAIIMAVVIGIYIIVDFFEKVDDFIETGVPIYKALIFFVFKTPFIIAQIMPICVLLSVLIVFGLMNKNNEIIALKSSGVSVYFLLKPVLLVGCFCSVLLFVLSEVVVPISMARANDIWLREVRNESSMVSKEKNIWVRGDRSISHIKFYSASKQTAHQLNIHRFDKNFSLIQRMDAEKGVFNNGRWILINLLDQQVIRRDGTSETVFYPRKEVSLDFTPDDLQRVVKKSEEMGFTELLGYIRKVEAEGYDATAYRVDLHAKLAFPFVCVIMCLLGTGISLRGTTREGLPLAVAYGVGTTFVFWIFYSFCLSLGYGEMLPYWIAAWIADFIFLCIGAFLLLSVE